MKKVARIFLPAIALLVFADCTVIRVSKPESFAELKGKGSSVYEAVSPEGILYRVRTVKNYPEQDLDFWSKALKNQLVKEGYTLIRDEERFEAGKRRGVLYEWGVPYGNKNYLYLTAIIIFDNKIAVAEAAGEHTLYRKYRDSLLASLTSITVK